MTFQHFSLTITVEPQWKKQTNASSVLGYVRRQEELAEALLLIGALPQKKDLQQCEELGGGAGWEEGDWN